jgi:hypothetical protein
MYFGEICLFFVNPDRNSGSTLAELRAYHPRAYFYLHAGGSTPAAFVVHGINAKYS